MPPHNSSAVIEIYPPHYYPPLFACLLNSSGIRHYGYFNGVSNWSADYLEHSTKKADRILYRKSNLEPPLDDILDLVRKAMLEGGFCDE